MSAKTSDRHATGKKVGQSVAGRRPSAVRYFSSRRELVDAFDRATGGMLWKVLSILDDGSAHLRELNTYAGRPHRWRFRTWFDAIGWTCKANSKMWRDVCPQRVRVASEAIGQALSAGGGGADELSRNSIQWSGLIIPEEVLRAQDAEGFAEPVAAAR